MTQLPHRHIDDAPNPRQSGPARRSSIASFVDQALSSATNFGCAALAAGLLTVEDFGAYSLGFAFYLVALGVSRAFTSDALVVLYSGAAPRRAHLATVRAARVAATIGVATGAIAVVVGLITAGTTGRVFMSLGACLPFLLIQDVWRFGYVMRREATKVCASDGAWLAISTVGLMALRLTDTRSVALATIAWGVGSVPGALVGCFHIVAADRRHSATPWLREVRPLANRYVVDFAVVAMSGYLMILTVAVFSGLEDAAGLRAAQVLMGPTTVAFLGASLYFVPEMARQRTNGLGRVRSLARIQSTSLALITGLWLLIVLSIPDAAGTRLFGASWEGGQNRLPLIGLAFVANALSTGPVSGLRALQWAKRGLRLRFIGAGMVLGATALGALYSVPTGALLGFAVGSFMSAGTWWAGMRYRASDDLIVHVAISDR